MATPSSGWRSQQDIPLPRAIDPNKFASAREPEVIAITEALKKSELGTRYGIDGIPRHLRRRTRSHNSYTHRRRPNATKQAILQNQMEVELQPSTTAPTTPSQQAQPPFSNRKMRRRPAKLATDCLSKASWSQAEIEDYKEVKEIDNDMIQDSPPPSPTPPPPPPRRLESHLWHAKRLSIVPTWNGWVLPEGEFGRGRGTRAFVRKLSTGAVIHDASYWCPALLSGPFIAVTGCLNLVIDPEIVNLLTTQLRTSSSKITGCEIEAMLHKNNCFPVKALAPVRILALPSRIKEHVSLCIWIHGAAVKEAFHALKAAVDAIKNTTGDGGLETPPPAAAMVLRPGQAAFVSLPDPRLNKPITLGSSTCSSLLNADSSNKVDFDIFSRRYRSPLTEAAISEARKEARRQLMVVGEATSDTPAEVGEATTVSLQGPTHCGAIFIRGYKGSKSCTGWSIILPPGWVMPIWVALAFQGCRATGQREWRWLHTLDHRSFFPYDVLDSPAYKRYIDEQHEHRQIEDEKRPPAKRFNLLNVDVGDCEHLSELLYMNHNERRDIEDRNLSARLLKNANIIVARSESSMLQALFGLSAAAAATPSAPFAGLCSGSGLRPVAKALASRKLQWVPRKIPEHFGRDLCLVEAVVNIINQGAIDEGAMIFVIWRNEAQLSKGQPCYLKYIGTYQLEEPGKRYAEYEKLIPIGLITSPAPQGTGRVTASMAVVTAAAFWRLRSLQYSEYRRDRGTVEAWIQNPRSSVIYPVRLSLLVERK
ncbi:hypothetical protein Ndes2526B_g01637 [Nannochloris sp. 'desiccata']